MDSIESLTKEYEFRWKIPVGGYGSVLQFRTRWLFENGKQWSAWKDVPVYREKIIPFYKEGKVDDET